MGDTKANRGVQAWLSSAIWAERVCQCMSGRYCTGNTIITGLYLGLISACKANQALSPCLRLSGNGGRTYKAEGADPGLGHCVQSGLVVADAADLDVGGLPLVQQHVLCLDACSSAACQLPCSHGTAPSALSRPLHEHIGTAIRGPMMWSAAAGCRLPRELSGRQVLTMILHPLVLQVGKPQHNLLEEAPCCGLLHNHQECI